MRVGHTRGRQNKALRTGHKAESRQEESVGSGAAEGKRQRCVYEDQTQGKQAGEGWRWGS